MATTLQDFRDILEKILVRGDVTTDPMSLVDNAVNWAIDEVARRFDFQCMWTTQAAQDTVATDYDYTPTTPAGFKRFKGMIGVAIEEASGKLGWLNPIGFNSAFREDFLFEGTVYDLSDPTEVAEPLFWAIGRGSLLLLRPTPDTVYELHQEMYCYLNDLVAVGDHNDITDDFPDLVLAKALVRMFWWMGETQESILQDQKAEREFSKVKIEQRAQEVSAKILKMRIPG